MEPTSIVKDKKYPQMYRLKWEDGVLSEDFYNLSRTNDILKNYGEYRKYMKMYGNKRASGQKEVPLDCIP